MAWERWQALPPERREQYLKQARGYAQQGRKAIEKRRRRRRR
jgi:ribosome recycling factor